MKITFNNPIKQINFKAHNQRQTPTGVDYNVADVFELSSKQSKTDMYDDIIQTYIPKIIEDARKFARKHPQFEENEVIQEFMLALVEAANDCRKNNNDFCVYNKYCTYRSLSEQMFERTLSFSAPDSLDELSDEEYVEDFERIEARQDLDCALDRIYEKQAKVIKMYLGLNDDGVKYDFDEIAKAMNLSRTQVMAIYRKGLKNLQSPTNVFVLKEYR